MNAAARAPAAQPQGGLQILQGSVSGDGEGFLLIDDLVDTGVKEFKQNQRIFFPWDTDYRLAKPIHDGGRATHVGWIDSLGQVWSKRAGQRHERRRRRRFP